MQQTLKVGYARWNHPANLAVRELLADDTKPGGIYHVKNLKPKELNALRPEYQKFPDKIFRDRLYKTKSRHIEKPYWVNGRNKVGRRTKVVEENMLQPGSL